MVKIIGLGEYMVSSNVEDSIKTYALASCVGLVVYNSKDKVLGMVHIVLPEKRDADGLEKKEGFFAEMAVPLIFQKVFGRFPDDKSLYQVALYGGCSSRRPNDMFNVGERNLARVEEILRKQNIRYDKKNTGGYYSRTIEAYVKDGTVSIHTQRMVI